MARIHDVSTHRRIALGGWEIAEAAADAVPTPNDWDGLDWTPLDTPGTVASHVHGAARDFDRDDWWYRCRIDAPEAEGRAVVLVLRGLATLADVWLDGSLVLQSDNMFHAHEIDLGSPPGGGRRELAIRFRSVRAWLKAKRARPRWRTRLVEQQQLRWLRTTLLGRIPGWTPPVAPVGPWRPIHIEQRAFVNVESADVSARVEGRRGIVSLKIRLRALCNDRLSPTVRALVGTTQGTLACTETSDGWIVAGEIAVPDARLWWPHTHGAQPRYAVSVVLRVGEHDVTIDLGRVAFRTLELDTRGGGFALSINGQEIFCRGACWMPVDPVTLESPRAELDRTLDLSRAAGMNMLRIVGTMFYEDDAFYEGCDERGILVWQDLPFANMDYPAEDPAFAHSVEREVREFLSRTQTCSALSVVCGNSEVAQQVAMLGLPQELAASALFDAIVPELVRTSRPDIAYVRSTPTGGELPFQIDSGVAHYFGVGGYRRPLEDARRCGVRFASECLGFSNVPEPRALELAGDLHGAKWKERIPRDSGVSWDFEDVRDHYVRVLFGVDVERMRWEDPDRYLALGRVATGEVIAQTLGEWRRPASTCRGALVWLLRDLWPGAGWGLLDSSGAPKAAYWHMRRAMQPIALLASDEGLDGLVLHVLNETDTSIERTLVVTLYQGGQTAVATGERKVIIPPRGEALLRAETMLPHFSDVTYAYRFGPPQHDLVEAALLGGSTPLRTFFFPLGLPTARETDLGVEAHVRPEADGTWSLTVSTNRFAQSIAIDAHGWIPDDAYFHLAPRSSATVTLRSGQGTPRGHVQPLNARSPTSIIVEAP